MSDRIDRELVTQIVQGELQTIREAVCVLNRFGQIAKEFVHLPGILQVTLVVLSEEFSGGIEVRVISNARENIEHLPAIRLGVKNAVGRQQWQMVLPGELNQRTDGTLFASQLVALDFNKKMIRSEDAKESFDNALG
jgi:hypothetical protein